MPPPPKKKKGQAVCAFLFLITMLVLLIVFEVLARNRTGPRPPANETNATTTTSTPFILTDDLTLLIRPQTSSVNLAVVNESVIIQSLLTYFSSLGTDYSAASFSFSSDHRLVTMEVVGTLDPLRRALATPVEISVGPYLATLEIFPSSSSSSNDHLVAIIVPIVVCVAVLILLVLLFLYIRHRRSHQKGPRRNPLAQSPSRQHILTTSFKQTPVDENLPPVPEGPESLPPQPVLEQVAGIEEEAHRIGSAPSQPGPGLGPGPGPALDIPAVPRMFPIRPLGHSRNPPFHLVPKEDYTSLETQQKSLERGTPPLNENLELTFESFQSAKSMEHKLLEKDVPGHPPQDFHSKAMHDNPLLRPALSASLGPPHKFFPDNHSVPSMSSFQRESNVDPMSQAPLGHRDGSLDSYQTDSVPLPDTREPRYFSERDPNHGFQFASSIPERGAPNYLQRTHPLERYGGDSQFTSSSSLASDMSRDVVGSPSRRGRPNFVPLPVSAPSHPPLGQIRRNGKRPLQRLPSDRDGFMFTRDLRFQHDPYYSALYNSEQSHAAARNNLAHNHAAPNNSNQTRPNQHTEDHLFDDRHSQDSDSSSQQVPPRGGAPRVAEPLSQTTSHHEMRDGPRFSAPRRFSSLKEGYMLSHPSQYSANPDKPPFFPPMTSEQIFEYQNPLAGAVHNPGSRHPQFSRLGSLDSLPELPAGRHTERPQGHHENTHQYSLGRGSSRWSGSNIARYSQPQGSPLHAHELRPLPLPAHPPHGPTTSRYGRSDKQPPDPFHEHRL